MEVKRESLLLLLDEEKLYQSVYYPRWENLSPEPMTTPSLDRYCLFPIEEQSIWQNYQTQKSRFWQEHEIDFSEDYNDWQKLSKNEQHFIAMVLAFFANSDNLIMENVFGRFLKDIQLPESRNALTFQAMMEGIHVVSYNMMIDTVIRDPQEKMKIFQACKHHRVVSNKMEWAKKWAGNPNCPIHECFLASGFSEGVFFTPSFASMFWLRKRQLCKGICFGNEKIVEDESLHVQLSSLHYKLCHNKMLPEDAYSMAQEAVDIEKEFVNECLPYRVKGMNAELMNQYTEKVCDVILEQFGYQPFYNVSNPFAFMDTIGLVGMSNFFEKRVGEYQSCEKEEDIHVKTFDNLGQELDF